MDQPRHRVLGFASAMQEMKLARRAISRANAPTSAAQGQLFHLSDVRTRSLRCSRPNPNALYTALVQIGGLAEKLSIFKDALSIEMDSIPYGRRSGVFQCGNGEIEPALANALQQLDTGNRDRGAPGPFEARHHIRSRPDVSMVLLDQTVQILRGPDLRVLSQQTISLHFMHCPVRSGITIERDCLRRLALMFDQPC